MPEEEEGNLRVRKLPQGLQKSARFAYTLLRVLVAEAVRANGRPQQLKVPGRLVYYAVREEGGIHNSAGISRWDDFTFGGVELKPDTSSGRSQGVEGFRHSLLGAREAKVVQVRKHKLQTCVRSSSVQVL